MKAFEDFKGIVLPLNRANVDTDAIIPKQYLKSIRRTGFESGLFSDWRYLASGKDNPDFVLNKPAYKNATILVTQNNFGCGSSREHAVWAICQYGFKVVIAPSVGEGESRIPAFADIFKNNSVKNGLLLIELSQNDVNEIMAYTDKNPGAEASIQLSEQTITLYQVANVKTFHFEVDANVKERFLLGLDDIGITLKEESAISTYEKFHQ